MITSSFFKSVSFGLSSLTFCALAFAATDSTMPSGGNVVIAEVDGTKLTLTDFEQKNSPGFFHARNVFYEAQRKVVDQAINEYLLERQAQKEGLTVPQLLERHLTSAIPKDPTEDALRLYYEGVETTQPYEAVRGQILDAIRQRRLAKARVEYVASLRNQAQVSIHLASPRAQVDLKDTPVRGRADAPVMIVEYADFECPYCQQIQPALEKLQAEYKDKLAFGYKQVPMPQHASAEKASEAALCAGAQGKYWEYHDELFHTKELAVPQLKEHARALKLDGKAFDACLDSGAEAPIIKTQLAEAQSYGLQGTPGFFVNGRFFGNGSSYEELHKLVEEELKAQAVRSTTTAAR